MGDALLASEQVTGSEILHLAGEVCGTYVMLARRVHHELPDAETLTQDFAARADLCSSARAVWAELETTLRSSVETLIEHKKQEDSRPIRTAKQYIQEHAAEPLTLEEVGGVVGFNASYFSSLFKKETGQNFLEYLSEVRMRTSAHQRHFAAKVDALLNDALTVAVIRQFSGFVCAQTPLSTAVITAHATLHNSQFAQHECRPGQA